MRYFSPWWLSHGGGRNHARWGGLTTTMEDICLHFFVTSGGAKLAILIAATLGLSGFALAWNINHTHNSTGLQQTNFQPPVTGTYSTGAKAPAQGAIYCAVKIFGATIIRRGECSASNGDVKCNTADLEAGTLQQHQFESNAAITSGGPAIAYLSRGESLMFPCPSGNDD